MYKIWKKLPKTTKSRLANVWYDLISRFNTGDDLVFMNHGYAPVKGNPHLLELSEHQEKHRYPIQLYHQLAAHVTWTGKDALEVSSGRGGGTSYLFDVFRPKSMIGIDLAQASVDFCNSAYAEHRGLSFMAGDAEDLPLKDACCDILVNIESSLNYPNQAQFFAEVDRVLRPGGYFVFADYRSAGGMKKLRSRVDALGYAAEHIENVSANIVRALELADPQKQEMLRRRVPAPLRSLAASFSFTGAAAREEIARFETGKKEYMCAILRKPDAV